MLDDDARIVAGEAGRRGQRRRQLLPAVGRIEKNDVELSSLQPRLSPGKVNADNSIALADPAVREVPRYEVDGPPIALDEGDVRSAAAQRLDADRSRAGVGIEHARALNRWAEYVEQRLPQPVRRRPQPVPLG